MDIAIDLNHLTEGERDAILNVLSRDDSLKKRDRERIQKLKTEIKQIRVRGAIKAGQDAEKTCARCREPFGWLFNKPALCPKCQHKICQRCQKSVNDNKWLCELCHKQMEFDAMSNTWFNSQFRRSKRNPKTEKVVSGAELIKSSIRRGGYDGSKKSANDKVRAALVNNNSFNKKASLERTAPSDAECSDTQSTEAASPVSTRSDYQATAFPQQEEKKFLMHLLKSSTGNPKSLPQSLPPVHPPQPRHSEEVKRVANRQLEDAGSSSDSASDDSSHVYSSRNESLFTRSDSIRSSNRSVSIISSDGGITMVTDTISDLDYPLADSPMVGPSPSTSRKVDKGYSNPVPGANERMKEPQIPLGPIPVIVKSSNSESSSSSSDSDSEYFIEESPTKIKFKRVPSRNNNEADTGNAAIKKPKSDNSHDDNSTVIRKEQIQLSETKFTGKEHVDSPFSANQRYDHVDSEMTINDESRSYNPHHPESDNGSISTATWKSKSGPGQYGPCSSTPLRQAPMDKENPLQPLQALEHVAESTNLSALSDHSPILPSLSSSSSSSHASGNGGGTQGACDNLSLVLGGTAAAADVDSTESIRTKVDGILARYGGRVHGSHVGDDDDNDDDDDDDGRYQVRASDPLHSLPSDVTHTSFQRHQISSTNIMQGKDNNNKMFAFSESDDDGLIAENSGSLEAMAWDGRDFDGYSIENNGKVSLHDAKPTEVDSTDGLEVDNEMSPNVQQLVDMIAAHRVGNDEDDEDSLSVISERTEPESDISIDSDVHLSVADFPDNNTTGEHKYTTGDDMIKANYDKVVDELNHRGEDMAKPRQGDIGAVKSTGKTLKKQAHVSDSAKIDSPLFASLDTLALEQSKHQPDEPDEDLDVLLLRNQAYEDEIPVPVLPHCTIDEPVEVVGATLGARNPNTGQMSQTRDMETTQPDLTSQDSLDISIGNQNPQVIDSDLDLDAPLGQNPDQDDAETETIPEEKFSETNTNTSLPEQEGDEKVDEVSTPASTENVHPTESVIRETSLGNGFPYEEPQNDDSEVAKVSPMEDVNAGVKRSALIRQDTLDILAGNQKGYIQASDLDGDLEELLAGNPDLEGTESVPCHIAEEKNPETDKKNSPSGLEEEGEEIVVLREAPSKHSALEEFIVVKSNSEDQIFSDGIYLDTNNGKLLPRRESITPNEEYVMIVEENVTEFTSPPTVTESTSPPTVTESTSPPTVTVDESAVTSSEESLNLVVPTNITSGEVIDLQMEEAITQLDAKSKVSMGLIYEDIDDDSVAESCSSDTIGNSSPWQPAFSEDPGLIHTECTDSDDATNVLFNESDSSVDTVKLSPLVEEINVVVAARNEIPTSSHTNGGSDSPSETCEITPSSDDDSLLETQLTSCDNHGNALPGDPQLVFTDVAKNGDDTPRNRIPTSDVDDDLEVILEQNKDFMSEEDLQDIMNDISLSKQESQEDVFLSTKPQNAIVEGTIDGPIVNEPSADHLECNAIETSDGGLGNTQNASHAEKRVSFSESMESFIPSIDISGVENRISVIGAAECHDQPEATEQPNSTKIYHVSEDDDSDNDTESNQDVAYSEHSTVKPDATDSNPTLNEGALNSIEHDVIMNEPHTQADVQELDPKAEKRRLKKEKDEAKRKEKEDRLMLKKEIEEEKLRKRKEIEEEKQRKKKEIEDEKMRKKKEIEEAKLKTKQEKQAAKSKAKEEKKVAASKDKKSRKGGDKDNSIDNKAEADGNETADVTQAAPTLLALANSATDEAPEGSGSSLPEADMMTAEGDTTDGQNIPATDTSVSGSSPRPHDDRMSRGSGSSEREDNIEEMFAAHAHKNNLLSPHSISRESLASYYSDAGEANYGKIPVSGDILFGLNYNYKISTMEISVKECRDLAPVDTKKNRSDPYVKTYLLPDKSKSGKRKTRVRKNSLNPTFNEVLKYQVTKSELQTRTLWITVWNNDVLGRNDFLGEVTISLEYYHFTSSEPKWYKLQERLQVSSCTTLTYKGEIQLSLKYITPENVQFVKGKSKKVPNKGELHALISGCQNLTAVRSNGSSNPFCKGYLLPDKSSKVKTPVIKHTCNPTWKHTFMFDGVSAEDLGQFCLELTVWDHDRLTSNDFLGGVRIGLGSGFSKDKEVDWMDSEGREIELWQNMMDRPNFWVEGTLPLRSNMTPVKK